MFYGTSIYSGNANQASRFSSLSRLQILPNHCGSQAVHLGFVFVIVCDGLWTRLFPQKKISEKEKGNSEQTTSTKITV